MESAPPTARWDAVLDRLSRARAPGVKADARIQSVRGRSRGLHGTKGAAADAFVMGTVWRVVIMFEPEDATLCLLTFCGLGTVTIWAVAGTAATVVWLLSVGFCLAVLLVAVYLGRVHD